MLALLNDALRGKRVALGTENFRRDATTKWLNDDDNLRELHVIDVFSVGDVACLAGTVTRRECSPPPYPDIYDATYDIQGVLSATGRLVLARIIPQDSLYDVTPHALSVVSGHVDAHGNLTDLVASYPRIAACAATVATSFCACPYRGPRVTTDHVMRQLVACVNSADVSECMSHIAAA